MLIETYSPDNKGLNELQIPLSFLAPHTLRFVGVKHYPKTDIHMPISHIFFDEQVQG